MIEKFQLRDFWLLLMACSVPLLLLANAREVRAYDNRGSALSAVLLQSRGIRTVTCDRLRTVLDRAEASKDPAEMEQLFGSAQGFSKRECVGVLLAVLENEAMLYTRAFVIQELVGLGDESVIRGIETAMSRNPDFRIRRRLASVIENIGTPGAAEYLGLALVRTSDETLRSAIPTALGRIGTPESVDHLVNAATMVGPAELPYIVKGLATIRNEEALPSLWRLFESSSLDSIRVGVALALGNYNNGKVCAAVESYLKTESSEEVRKALHVSWARFSEEVRKQTK